MTAIMVSLSKAHGINWAVFSPEEHPTDQHMTKIIEIWSGHRCHVDNLNDEQALKYYKEAAPHFRFIEPDEDHLTLPYILEVFNDSIENNKTTGIVIDPWNELTHQRSSGQNESDYIGESLRTCRRFARTKNVLFFILAHPAKMDKETGTKTYDVPTLYNIHGSAHWFNKSDNGLTVYRLFDSDHPENERVEIYVQKIKFRNHGQVGVSVMKYNKYNGRFTEVENGF
jgi:twinkle protein